MEFGLKWVHMAWYGVILRLDGALWLPIIFKPLLTPKRAITIQFDYYFGMSVTEKVFMIWNVSLFSLVGQLLLFAAIPVVVCYVNQFRCFASELVVLHQQSPVHGSASDLRYHGLA